MNHHFFDQYLAIIRAKFAAREAACLLTSCRGRSSPVKRDQSPHVVDQVHQAHLDRRTGQPDHPHQHAALLVGLRTKDMLDTRTGFRFLVVGTYFLVSERFVAMALVMNVAPVARSRKHQLVLLKIK